MGGSKANACFECVHGDWLGLCLVEQVNKYAWSKTIQNGSVSSKSSMASKSLDITVHEQKGIYFLVYNAIMHKARVLENPQRLQYSPL